MKWHLIESPQIIMERLRNSTQFVFILDLQQEIQPNRNLIYIQILTVASHCEGVQPKYIAAMQHY